jgi:multidrug efflux system outer membrane protein
LKALPLRMAAYSAACTVLLLTSCAPMQPAPDTAPAMRNIAPLAVDAKPDTTYGWPEAQWWQNYHDTTLDALVQRALESGPRIATAMARLESADQDLRAQRAALGFRADFNAEYEQRRLSDNGLLPARLLGFNWYDQSSLDITIRHQFDWWGKQRAAVTAGVDRSRAVAAEAQATSLGLAAAVCEAYWEWQAAGSRITLREHGSELLLQALQLAEHRARANLDSNDTVLGVQRMQAVYAEQVAALRGEQQLRIVILAALLGVSATELPALAITTLPAPLAELPADAGINLLSHRPDVMASRWRVEAAIQDRQRARAAFYPDVSLHVLAGLSSVDLGRLLRSDSAAPAAGLAFSLPLFDSGLLRARHGIAQAELASAVATYHSAVVAAAQETGSAVVRLRQLHAQREQRRQQLELTRALYRQAERRATAGLANLRPQLEAKLAELDEQDAVLQLDLGILLADVQLQHALGGQPQPTTGKQR